MDLQANERPKPKPKPTKPVDNAQLPKAKRNKLKKIKEKYGDQDEEDRALALKLIGAEGTKKTLKEKQKLRAEKRKKKVEDKNIPDKTEKIIVPIEKVESEEEEEENEENDDQEGENKDQKQKKKEGNKKEEVKVSRSEKRKQEKEEIKAIMGEDGEDDEKNIKELDSLTGIPKEDDVLLYAIPMCAPYSSIINFKYKVKITPGSTKKGKAIKETVQFFQHLQDATPQEKNLIKICPENEISQQIISSLKISTPGLQSSKAKDKKKKASKPKEEDLIIEEEEPTAEK